VGGRLVGGGTGGVVGERWGWVEVGGGEGEGGEGGARYSRMERGGGVKRRRGRGGGGGGGVLRGRVGGGWNFSLFPTFFSQIDGGSSRCFEGKQ